MAGTGEYNNDWIRKYDFCIISEDRDWAKLVSQQLEARRPGIRCVTCSPHEFQSMFFHYDVKASRMILVLLVGFKSVAYCNYIMSEIVKRIDYRSQLILVKNDEDAELPEGFDIFTVVNFNDEDFYEKLLKRLDEQVFNQYQVPIGHSVAWSLMSGYGRPQAPQPQFRIGHPDQPSSVSGYTASALEPHFRQGHPGQPSSVSGRMLSGASKHQYPRDYFMSPPPPPPLCVESAPQSQFRIGHPDQPSSSVSGYTASASQPEFRRSHADQPLQFPVFSPQFIQPEYKRDNPGTLRDLIEMYLPAYKPSQASELIPSVSDGPQWNPTESTVPLEIFGQGFETVKAFNEALKQGTAKVKQGRLIVMGLERVGKTSTIKSFLKKEFNSEEPCTDGIATNKTYIQDSPDVWNEAPKDICVQLHLLSSMKKKLKKK